MTSLSSFYFESTVEKQLQNYNNAIEISRNNPGNSPLKILCYYHYAGLCKTPRTLHDLILAGVIKEGPSSKKAKDIMTSYLQYQQECKSIKETEKNVLAEVKHFFEALDSKDAIIWLPVTLLTQTIIQQNDYTTVSESEFIRRINEP